MENFFFVRGNSAFVQDMANCIYFLYLDFGVAYVQPEGTEGVLTCNLASGTKQYLAPEVYCKRYVRTFDILISFFFFRTFEAF